MSSQNINKLLLGIFGLVFVACGFHLRGFNKLDNKQQIEYIQVINFSPKLQQFFIDKVNGVANIQAGSEKYHTSKNVWLINIFNEKLEENEDLLDSTTYNKVLRIKYTVSYTIEDLNNIQPKQKNSRIIEKKAQVYLSEADRLSGDIKIRQTKENLYNEVALILLRSVLQN